MKVVSVINYKGGVGKTTLTANLGSELAWRGKKVLLLDLDAQASLTFSFLTPDEWANDYADTRTIKSWFDAFEKGGPIPLASLINSPKKIKSMLKGGKGQLDISCSHLGLINVDLVLAVKLGGATLAQAKANFVSVHKRLADGLSEREFLSYDVILIDCPPNFNIVTKTAIVASDFILIPTRADQLSTLGIDYLKRSMNVLQKDYNDYADVDDGEHVEKISPKTVGVVFTMIQEYRRSPIAPQKSFITQLKRKNIAPIFKSYIKRNDSIFSDSPVYGIPVVLNHYNSPSHRSVVKGIESVASEFIKSVGI